MCAVTSKIFEQTHDAVYKATANDDVSEQQLRLSTHTTLECMCDSLPKVPLYLCTALS